MVPVPDVQGGWAPFTVAMRIGSVCCITRLALDLVVFLEAIMKIIMYVNFGAVPRNHPHPFVVIWIQS